MLIGTIALGLSIGLLSSTPSSSPSSPPTFNDCRGCPEMVAVPPGSFLMGSPADELGRDNIEGKQRRVTVRAFAIGRQDVTRGQWADFVAATRRKADAGCEWSGPEKTTNFKLTTWRKLGFPQDDKHPVVCVTWQDARDYTAWLSQRTGQRYRLPSEAEWEYAARAGTTTPYHWGNEPSHDHANYGTEDCCGGFTQGRDHWQFTSPAGAFPPNAWGLFDMSGNVLQFVEDCFAPDPAGLPTDGSPNLRSTNPPVTGDLAVLNGTQACDYRVVRGGDWGDRATWVRSAARSFAPPPGPGPSLASYRSGGVGFRVVRELAAGPSGDGRGAKP